MEVDKIKTAGVSDILQALREVCSLLYKNKVSDIVNGKIAITIHMIDLGEILNRNANLHNDGDYVRMKIINNNLQLSLICFCNYLHRVLENKIKLWYVVERNHVRIFRS